MNEQSDHHLDGDKDEVQHDADHKGPVHIFRIDGMMMMPQAEAMTVIVAVVMGMIMRMALGIFHILRSYYLPAGYGAERSYFLSADPPVLAILPSSDNPPGRERSYR
jgi:hypothetical protein